MTTCLYAFSHFVFDSVLSDVSEDLSLQRLEVYYSNYTVLFLPGEGGLG